MPALNHWLCPKSEPTTLEAPMARRRISKKDTIDSAIEQAYYRLAAGRQISILKIPTLFNAVRDAVLIDPTVTLDAAVQAAIDKYCEPVKS
jgi:hypothetical protein